MRGRSGLQEGEKGLVTRTAGTIAAADALYTLMQQGAALVGLFGVAAVEREQFIVPCGKLERQTLYTAQPDCGLAGIFDALMPGNDVQIAENGVIQVYFDAGDRVCTDDFQCFALVWCREGHGQAGDAGLLRQHLPAAKLQIDHRSPGRPFCGQRRQTVVAAAGCGIFKGQGVEVQVLRAVGILGGIAALAGDGDPGTVPGANGLAEIPVQQIGVVEQFDHVADGSVGEMDDGAIGMEGNAHA